MKIRINNTTYIKNDLIERIKASKIESIKHIRETANIGLKDAHEVMENLNIDPNFYDRIHIKKTSRIKNSSSKSIAEKSLKEKLIPI